MIAIACNKRVLFINATFSFKCVHPLSVLVASDCEEG